MIKKLQKALEDKLKDRYTIKEISEGADVSRPVIKDIQRGILPTSDRTQEKLAKYFGFKIVKKLVNRG